MPGPTLLTNTEIVELAGIESTQLANIQSAEASTYSAAANAILTSIYNKICYQKLEKFEGFTNPFLEYDGFEVKYGDTIENIYFDRVTGYAYSKDSTDPFRPSVNVPKALYVSINYQMKYVTTIYKDTFKKAVLNEYGLQGIVDMIMATLTQGKEIDEYLAQIGFLGTADIYANRVAPVTPGNPYTIEELDHTDSPWSDVSTSAELGHAIAKFIISEQKNMQLPSTDNNVMGVMTSTPKSKSLLVIRQKVLDCIDMDYLVGVYNLDKTELMGRIIPVRDFQVIKNVISNPRTASESVSTSKVGADMDFVILDTRGFDNHPCLNETGSIFNPEALYTNHFLHFWKIFAYKQWFQAKAWKLDSTLRALL